MKAKLLKQNMFLKGKKKKKRTVKKECNQREQNYLSMVETIHFSYVDQSLIF